MPVDETQLRALTTQVTAAFVGNALVAIGDLPGLITSVYASFRSLAEGKSNDQAAAEPVQAPAVAIRKSVAADHIVCLDCGQKLKMLKRHIKTDHGLSPEAYRAKWSLPREYPMVAPNYARQRSELAVRIGLGRRSGDRE